MPSLPLANPAFSLLPCPLSPSPFPNGEGEIYGYFMQGASPLASPAFNRLRHLQSLPYRYPHGVAGFFNPDSRRPGGCQRSIQRRKNRFSTSKTSAASRPALGDARGEAPCIRKQKISPFPPGKSALRARAGGWGQESKLKARLAGSKQGKPPAGRVVRPHLPVPRRFSPGDARGEVPCIRKQKISPFPGGEERSASAGGGMGATKQAKGRVGKRQRRQAAPQGTAGAGRAVRKKANA